ncbi:MAG: hypothetical protein PGN13_03125 [Patulibacter minatonensis]
MPWLVSTIHRCASSSQRPAPARTPVSTRRSIPNRRATPRTYSWISGWGANCRLHSGFCANENE